MSKEETIDGVSTTEACWLYMGPQGVFSGKGKMPEELKATDLDGGVYTVHKGSWTNDQ